MNSVISFFLSFVFALMSFLGVPFSAPDLEKEEAFVSSPTDAQLELFEEVFEREITWLASLQLENGAIPMTKAENGEVKMSPYFADFAALALLDKGREYADKVKLYMDWHFSKLNSEKEDFNGLDGTIYDYIITLENGRVIEQAVSKPENADSYDSTDSYAATFLKVICKYIDKTGDIAYIADNARDIIRIASVMSATLEGGLTYAKPNHKVKYLMDNCEVYEGALAASRIFSLLGEQYKALSEEYKSLAEEIKTTVNKKMWNYVGNYYTPEMTFFSIPTKIFSWDKYYPCATAQLFPIASGIIEPDTKRAISLYGKFCESYKWEEFDYPDDFYWGANVYAAAIMNDLERVTAYMTNYLAVSKAHPWPIYNADSARVSMAAYIMLQRANAI